MQVEPWLERDKAMIDQLRSIGIEKGAPFAPDARTRDILNDAVREAHEWLVARYESSFSAPYYVGGHWARPGSRELLEGQATLFAKAGCVPCPPERQVVATVCYKCYDPCMNRVITQRELRNQSAAVLREVEAGRTFVVSRNGTPVAELRPIQPRRFVPRATIADAGGRAPHVDAHQFRADLDAVIDQGIDE